MGRFYRTFPAVDFSNASRLISFRRPHVGAALLPIPQCLESTPPPQPMRTLGFENESPGPTSQDRAAPAEAFNTQNPTGQLHTEAVRCILPVGREMKKNIPDEV